MSLSLFANLFGLGASAGGTSADAGTPPYFDFFLSGASVASAGIVGTVFRTPIIRGGPLW